MEPAKMASPKSAPKDAQVGRAGSRAGREPGGPGQRGPAQRRLSGLQVMAQILKDMGITEYEPRVINQMLEFTYSERGRGLCRALGRETPPGVPGGPCQPS